MGLGRGSDRGPNRSGPGWQAEPLPSLFIEDRRPPWYPADRRWHRRLSV